MVNLITAVVRDDGNSGVEGYLCDGGMVTFHYNERMVAFHYNESNCVIIEEMVTAVIDNTSGGIGVVDHYPRKIINEKP